MSKFAFGCAACQSQELSKFSFSPG